MPEMQLKNCLIIAQITESRLHKSVFQKIKFLWNPLALPPSPKNKMQDFSYGILI